MSSLLRNSLYRSLLRVGKQIDASEITKVLIVARPRRLWDRDKSKNIDLKDSEVENHLYDFNNGEFNFPSRKKFSKLIRSQFRESQKEDLQLGFTALRRLSDALYMSDALLSSTDGPKPPTYPSASALSLIDTQDIVTGTMLLTHPISCISQEAFHRAIIALSFEEKESNVFGLILNKPLPDKVKDCLPARLHQDFEPFLDNRLYLGGVVRGPLIIVHKYAEAPDSRPLSLPDAPNQLFFTFISRLEILEFFKEKVNDGCDPNSLIFCYQHSAWDRDQLESELERNVWFPASGANVSNEILEFCATDDADTNEDSLSLGLWQAYVQTLGTQFEPMSSFPDLNSADFQERLGRFLEGHYQDISEILDEKD